MELPSWMKMLRFQTFWIQMRKNKPLDESRKTGQTSGTKMAFLLINNKHYIYTRLEILTTKFHGDRQFLP
ncbi:hypothetical protein Hanom_Chr11g00975211 [Helianthus anomalus]